MVGEPLYTDPDLQDIGISYCKQKRSKSNTANLLVEV